ncbi:hypothetical protein [Thermomonas aquatica]|jgi:hypothetical protein|uniref:Uncharacterized protein n=1 Tax=Thermomonas aquatica TaxID=2202149 RepID=A0A5B7ZRD7_9GAMM|nr:hypothetical protein [Thermomonas aquatica]QDA57289.1 hypothetical protein FHQ07_08170 [Thermomonas aquatica]
MTRSVRSNVIAVLLTLVAFDARPASLAEGHPSEDETAVLAAMDRYLLAPSTNDLRAMAAMQTPEGMTYRAHTTDAGAIELIVRRTHAPNCAPETRRPFVSRVDG